MDKKNLIFDIVINIVLGTVVASIISYFFDLTALPSTFVGIGTAFMCFCGFILWELINNQKMFLEKIQKDLIDTHGIVKPHENKLAITAQIMKFHDEKDYKKRTNPEQVDVESIDLVRSFTYQDLILSPKYLNYFFNRIKTQNNDNNIHRIIVIKNACQASLTYVVLSYLAGYKTYIIGDKYFRDFRESHIPSRNRMMCDIFKGNPYIEKNGTTYEGKYSIYQSHDDAPTVKPINGSNMNDVYTILSCLKDNYCSLISETIFERLTSINELETILSTKKQKDKCCDKVKKT